MRTIVGRNCGSSYDGGTRQSLGGPDSQTLLEEGAFDVQGIATVATVKLERKLGHLLPQEFETVLDRLAERLGL